MLYQGAMYCLDCESPSLTVFSRYYTQSNGERCIYQCDYDWRLKQGLQRALDLQWIMHNFVRPHFTTGEIPAVALGIHDQGVSVSEFLMMRPLAS